MNHGGALFILNSTVLLISMTYIDRRYCLPTLRHFVDGHSVTVPFDGDSRDADSLTFHGDCAAKILLYLSGWGRLEVGLYCENTQKNQTLSKINEVPTELTI